MVTTFNLNYNRYNKLKEIWEAFVNSKSGFIATTKATEKSLALGKNLWTISNDSRDCSEEESYSLHLTLSGCSETEFTCFDGSCISMQRRCNRKLDCRHLLIFVKIFFLTATSG